MCVIYYYYRRMLVVKYHQGDCRVSLLHSCSSINLSTNDIYFFGHQLEDNPDLSLLHPYSWGFAMIQFFQNPDSTSRLRLSFFFACCFFKANSEIFRPVVSVSFDASAFFLHASAFFLNKNLVYIDNTAGLP